MPVRVSTHRSSTGLSLRPGSPFLVPVDSVLGPLHVAVPSATALAGAVSVRPPWVLGYPTRVSETPAQTPAWRARLPPPRPGGWRS